MLILYGNVIKTWTYFSLRKIPFERGIRLIGWLWKVFIRKSSVTVESVKLYNKYPNDRFIGVYDMGEKPSTMIRDSELIKIIYINEFDFFHES